MGPETFCVCELIPQKGDDGLPHDLLQVDVEDSVTKKHIVRIFLPVANLRQLLFEQKS